MARVRLDSLLAERGLFPSRTRAAAAVMAGEVRLGAGGRRAEKPGQLVPADVELAVAAPPPFVSRGGIKLANALDALGLDPAGRRALDVGASTGGFTDCLLQRGAAHVVALDVAYGELAHALRSDPRVTVLERVNARALDPAVLPYRARPRRRRRLLHLAGQGAARRCWPARRSASTPSRWSSRSSRWGGSGSARAASCATRRCGARRSSASPRRPARRAPPCSASRPRACRGPRATARRSCGSPRRAAPARWTTSPRPPPRWRS